MRVCIVYDCLFPYTIGGGERWYRSLAERLAREGHEVTYLTLRQWERGSSVELPGVRVVTAGPRMALYTRSGRRRVLPPLVFGVGVLLHLLGSRRRYEVVDTSSFPYFSLLAAAAVRPLLGFELVVDWFEVWSDSYWREYLGPLAGRAGVLVQRLCARVPQRAFCISELHARRLREEGLKGGVTVLRGLYAGSAEAAEAPPIASVGERRAAGRVDSPARSPQRSRAEISGEPLVLFAGRLIPEKHVTLAVAAIGLAAERIEGLRGEILGDGPERSAMDEAIRTRGLTEIVSAPGFVDSETVVAEMRRASCLLLTSRREGYGLVVVEAAAHGTPSVVVAGEDNAATELIVEGVNGTIAARADPQTVADAIERVHAAGAAMRESTARWFAENAERLSLESSLRTVLASYASSARR
ncbi:MAG TPA: glycosyltransferase [Solirubrobacteraceae bacterium]|nr:glycosyltransferase [Solirubrobacteraceae bacterium]